jgi:hypothetical protein
VKKVGSGKHRGRALGTEGAIRKGVSGGRAGDRKRTAKGSVRERLAERAGARFSHLSIAGNEDIVKYFTCKIFIRTAC